MKRKLGVFDGVVWLKYKSQELVAPAIIKGCEVVRHCHHLFKHVGKIFAKTHTLLCKASSNHPKTAEFVAIHELETWVGSLLPLQKDHVWAKIDIVEMFSDIHRPQLTRFGNSIYRSPNLLPTIFFELENYFSMNYGLKQSSFFS